MNTQNSKDFDALEEALNENNIPIEDLLSIYRDFLEDLANNEKFTAIPKKSLTYIRDCLKKSIRLLAEGKEEERKAIRNSLWALADENRETNPDLYNLARCTIIIYGKMEDWDVAQDSPVFYCLFYLRKILPDIEPDFIRYFKTSLLR
ncbi:hypothetical protein J2W39_003168 [Variovorax paradoxus]|uniref:Uncharacterized protein n=1 Tax=Variovorax paradoxus TaxID=34073 RepID=A0AAW8EFJ3_VARPD|nr:hypothetical protein [Variovorax paradoxus]MDP9971926.1 hypothetical protein [Variovorax paradoxus]